jgi:hypothetical protein
MGISHAGLVNRNDCADEVSSDSPDLPTEVLRTFILNPSVSVCNKAN